MDARTLTGRANVFTWTFVAGSQVIRLVLMLLSAPLIVGAMRWWITRAAR